MEIQNSKLLFEYYLDGNYRYDNNAQDILIQTFLLKIINGYNQCTELRRILDHMISSLSKKGREGLAINKKVQK